VPNRSDVGVGGVSREMGLILCAIAN
jgi:hypothetical protein